MQFYVKYRLGLLCVSHLNWLENKQTNKQNENKTE